MPLNQLLSSPVPIIMGIVNVTPDSFSDGGRFGDVEAAVAHALQLINEGAHVLDIGGESTRPGSDLVPEAEELARILPVIEALRGQTNHPISVDTRKPGVAHAAIAAGADMWNDVSALTYDETSVTTAAELGVPVVLMHAQGDPKTMQDAPTYTDVVEEVLEYLRGRREAAIAAGVSEEKILLDPGIGFGKSVEHNIALLAHLDRFTSLGGPVLLGTSRKRFIAAIDRDGPADQRLGGSLATVLAGWQRGATWFRVHDVAATRQALAVAQAISAKDHV